MEQGRREEGCSYFGWRFIQKVKMALGLLLYDHLHAHLIFPLVRMGILLRYIYILSETSNILGPF